MKIVAPATPETQDNRGMWFSDIIEVMKRELIDILACPVCKGRLELSTNEETEKEIVNGSLYCQKCGEHYPIVDTIPNVLPPDQRG